MKGKKYILTDDWRRYLIRNFANVANSDIAVIMDCSVRTVIRFARQLDLHKSAEYMKNAQRKKSCGHRIVINRLKYKTLLFKLSFYRDGKKAFDEMNDFFQSELGAQDLTLSGVIKKNTTDAKKLYPVLYHDGLKIAKKLLSDDQLFFTKGYLTGFINWWACGSYKRRELEEETKQLLHLTGYEKEI